MCLEATRAYFRGVLKLNAASNRRERDVKRATVEIAIPMRRIECQ